MSVLVVAQAAASTALAGLIWFVQVVHYPMFSSARVPGGFPAYEVEHSRRTTLVVVPPMLVEAATAGLLVVLDPGALTVLGVILVVMLWLSTFLVQVPCHRALSLGWDPAAHRRLVRTNWARTALWTARAAVALALLA